MICTDEGLMLEKLASLTLHGGWDFGLITNFSPNKKDWQNVFHKFLSHTKYLFLIVILLSFSDTGVV